MIASTRATAAKQDSNMRDAFAHVENWVFDLDDTLYPRSVGVHEQLKHRVVTFVAEQMKIDLIAAEAMHIDYYERFGSTLQARVELHGTTPAAFLDFVHDIDLSVLAPNAALIARLDALPGKRVVFTNASRGHASAALAAMGMSHLFDVIASIEDSGFVGKPHLSAFENFFEKHAIRPNVSAMFEDRPGNLLVPSQLGMKTVLVVDPMLPAKLFDDANKPDHVDVVVTNLTTFLDEITILA
jgi:putative hydrolase of the HAD superfamily